MGQTSQAQDVKFKRIHSLSGASSTLAGAPGETMHPGQQAVFCSLSWLWSPPLPTAYLAEKPGANRHLCCSLYCYSQESKETSQFICAHPKAVSVVEMGQGAGRGDVNPGFPLCNSPIAFLILGLRPQLFDHTAKDPSAKGKPSPRRSCAQTSGSLVPAEVRMREAGRSCF